MMRSELYKIIRTLALTAHQAPGESQRLRSPVGTRAKLAFAVVCILGLFAMFVPIFVEQIGDWSEAGPNVPFPKEIWHVSYHQGSAPCAADARASRGCPASPTENALWQSPFLKTDRAHQARVQSRQGSEFWIGATVPVELLREALKARANYITIGWIRSLYRIWVDGAFVLEGDHNEIEPVTLSVSMPRLAEPRPLRIAIEIIYDSDHPMPDYFNGPSSPEGFLTSSRVNARSTFQSFVNRVRPFSIFLASALMACLFFLFWAVARAKQEYFYMAVYSVLNALVQLRYLDLVFTRMSTGFTTNIDIFLRCYEGAFAMFLGLAFARTRQVVFRYSLPVVLVAPCLALVALPDAATRAHLREWLVREIVPLFYAIGAVSCLLQGSYLFTQKKRGTYLPLRMKKLFLLAFSLGALCYVGLALAGTVATPMPHLIWYRFVHLGLVFSLGAIVFTEQRERELLVEKSIVSEYHRRAELPARLSGAVLMADLKASEQFFRHRAAHGKAENLVSIWRSHFYTSILRNNGVVIQRKGDEVIGFFDNDKCPNPCLSALRATEDMAQVSRLLEREFRGRGAYPPDARGLHFRGAIAKGAIRPIWEDMGSQREAYWEEAGNTTPFVDAARLLEFERQFARQGDSSLIVLADELSDELLGSVASLESGFVFRKRAVADKRGSIYYVSVFRPAEDGEHLTTTPTPTLGRTA